MSAVLVVDAEWAGRRATAAALRYGGFETDAVSTVREAARRLRRRRYAGIIVDTREAAADIAELRTRTDVPLIALTATDDRDHMIECLDAGADDYMVRPVDPEALLARLRAVLRRVPCLDDAQPVVTDDFTLDLADRRLVRADNGDVVLSPTEWRLVEMLARHSGHLVSREDLLVSIWGPGASDKPQYLRVHMASIRHKVEPDPAHPRYFVTVPGLGLRFDPTGGAVETRSGSA